MKSRTFFLLLVVGLLSVLGLNASGSEPSAVIEPKADSPTVSPMRQALFSPKANDKRTSQYLRDYHASLFDWGQIVQKQVRAVPNEPSLQYLGLPRNVEDDVRPTAYAAMVLGFLSETRLPEQRLSPAARETLRNNAIGLLRYLAHSHVSGGGTCLNGKPWGNQWQSAMWARATCFAGWQLWPHLDPKLQDDLVKMLVFEADRFVSKQPKSGLHNDTGAEENAWNASITALACNMLPDHLRAKSWETASKKYMYNTFSVKADQGDKTLGDDGIAIKDWVTTLNAHDDFTVENHRLVHVGYLKNSACMIQENGIHWIIRERTAPQACSHHLAEVFRVLCSDMNWSGSPIYFSGNDWRLYETQCMDVVLYCMRSLLSDDPHAAHLERVALDQLRKQQMLEKGFFNGRRDLEFGGLCATRLIACFFAHASLGCSESIASEEEFDSAMNGVLHLESAKTILHRTKSKFASFSWAQKRMGLTLPSESSAVWPHYSSYLGIINERDSSERHSTLAGIHIDQETNGFAVTGSLLRCKGQLEQDFYFASPPEDYTIYVERLRPKDGFKLKSRQTGIVGLNYPVGQNQCLVSGDFGEKRIQGRGGKKATHRLASDWLNLENTIGYVVLRPAAGKNVMRLHDKTNYPARRPHLHEWISLIGDPEDASLSSPEWACVVTFVNLSAEETSAKQDEIEFEVHEGLATLRIGKATYQIDFEKK